MATVRTRLRSARLDDGTNLIIECKGIVDDKAEATAQWTVDHWIPSVAGTVELPDELRRWSYRVIRYSDMVAHDLYQAISKRPSGERRQPMSPRRASKPTPPAASTYRHAAASRPNQPTVGTEPLMSDEQRGPLPFHVDRRDITRPVLAWDRQGRTSRMEGDPTALTPPTPSRGYPYTHRRKINPLAMVDQLRRPDTGIPLNLFDDFNGLPPEANTWEFYQHSGHWQNRLVHGDSSEVMQSLIVRDGLAGRVQMVYFDPPYGIAFRSNFMTSTDQLRTKDSIDKGVPVGDPAPLRAYGDTYRNGIHSYLDGIHERLVLARPAPRRHRQPVHTDRRRQRPPPRCPLRRSVRPRQPHVHHHVRNQRRRIGHEINTCRSELPALVCQRQNKSQVPGPLRETGPQADYRVLQ